MSDQLVHKIKIMLARHAITPGNARNKGLDLAEAAIDIRQTMRFEGRESPNPEEAEALILIAEAAFRMSTPAHKAPDMCFLTNYEMEDYKLLMAC